jgi:Flp pilus assembly pilin Flp
MLNLVEKFTPEAVEATDEDGVVAIEYVLMAALAAAVVVALGVAFGGLGERLSDVIDTVVSVGGS